MPPLDLFLQPIRTKMTTAATVAYRLYFPNHKVKLGNTRAKTKNATSAFYHNLAVTPTLFCQVANPKPLHLNSHTHCLSELRLSHSKPPLSLSKPPPPTRPQKKKEGKENSSPHGVADAAKPTPQLRSVNARGGIASIPLRFVYLFFFLVKMELLAFFFPKFSTVSYVYKSCPRSCSCFHCFLLLSRSFA